jgi:hypothetical protein
MQNAGYRLSDCTDAARRENWQIAILQCSWTQEMILRQRGMKSFRAPAQTLMDNRFGVFARVVKSLACHIRD